MNLKSIGLFPCQFVSLLPSVSQTHFKIIICIIYNPNAAYKLIVMKLKHTHSHADTQTHIYQIENIPKFQTPAAICRTHERVHE